MTIRSIILAIGGLALISLVWGLPSHGENAAPSTKPRTYMKPDSETLKKKLTPLQYKVTQKDGTEPAFKNEYWNNKEPGIYVDIVSGEPLFSSVDKFESGTGWPSFSKPLESPHVVEKEDRSFFMKRVEVRSKDGDSHLGHLFPDGPAPTGLRYCINSASLRFVSANDLEKEGYGQYASLFDKATTKTETETATLAGGCFWGVEELFRTLPGVVETVVGYTGGTVKDPAYPDITTGKSGHAESLEIRFDPKKVSYEDILLYFFKIHDPTTLNQQGNDRGTQYRSAIFYHDDRQKEVATKVKSNVEKSGQWKKPVVTEIVKAGQFYLAEEYHQDYLQKNPRGYTCHYERKIEF